MKDISKYTSFFHDGSICTILHKNTDMVISMESAEVSQEDIDTNLILSKNDRLTGKLHLENIRSVKENDKPYFDILTMKNDDAEIFHFKIATNNIKLQIIWNSIPPMPTLQDFSTIEIEAEKIWWENIPNLESERMC